MKLHEIREARAGKIAEMRSLTDGDMSAEKKARFDSLKQEVVALEADEQRAAFLADAEKRSMAGQADKPFNKLQSEVSIVEVLRNATEGRAQSGAAAEFAKETELRTGRKAQGIFVPLSALETRATVTTGTAGEIVPTTHRPDQYIEPFRNNLLARRLGVRVLSGLSGNLSIPKYGTGTTTGWVAEDAALTASDMTFDSVTMTPKHAGGLVEMSRQLLQQSSPDIEQLVRNDLSAMLAQAIDSALINGGGTNEPKGVLTTTGIQTASLSTLSFANVLAMLEKLDLVNAGAANFVGSTKVKAKLAGTLKAAGIAGYLLEGGRLADLPAYFSNQVPEKAGTPNKLRLIAGDWSQVMLGIWSEIDLLVNPYAETAYNKGNVLVRAMTTCDIALRHPQAFVVADDIAL